VKMPSSHVNGMCLSGPQPPTFEPNEFLPCHMGLVIEPQCPMPASTCHSLLSTCLHKGKLDVL
jgi:hypothetical protein